MTWATFFQLVFSGLAIGAIYGLVALSYNVVFNTTNVVNFAQGELVVLGSLAGVTLYAGQKLPLVVALVVAAMLVAAVALLSQLLAVRPVKDVTRNFIWIMSTFGFGVALNQVMQAVWGTQPMPFPKWIGGDAPIKVGGVVMLPQEIGIVLIAAAVTVALELYKRQTIFGKAVRATALDRSTAGLMGINTSRVIYFSYALSGAIATLCGFLLAPVQFADPNYGIVIGVKGFIALIIGGLGSGIGGFLGGLFLGLLEVASARVFSEVWKDVVTFLALILVMMVKPSGFFGAWK
jgi:branched-chain amino acid transport system permease protein